VLLLQRTTRTLALTTVGAEYHARCQHIVEQAREANAQAAETGDTVRGLLRVTAPEGLVTAFFNSLFADFLHAHPRVSMELLTTNRAVDLLEEGIDVALRVSPPPRDAPFVARRLGPTHLSLWASPTYLQRRGLPRTPQELSSHDCLVLASSPMGASWRLSRREESVELRVQGRLTVNTLHALCEAACAGLGIAQLPSYYCETRVRSGQLRTVLEDWATQSPSLYAFYSNGRHPTAKVRAFVHFISERIAALPVTPGPPERSRD
jgi:DNA-binding transcriptional LysR family regulator